MSLDQETQQRLPSPKGAALAIMEACRRDDATARDVANLVQTDPALLGRILQQANAAALGGRAVVSATDAVGRLGLQTVRLLALTFSLIDQNGQGKCAGFEYSRFWSHSLLMALAMKQLGAELRHGAPDELFTCGLLARVGCLALATVYPDEYTKLLLTGPQSSELVAAEQLALHTDHLELSVTLLKQWGIPLVLAEPALFHENPEAAHFELNSRPWKLTRLMHLSWKLADFLMASEQEHPCQIAGLTVLATQMGFSPESFAPQVDTLIAQWRAWGDKLQVQTSALMPFEKMVQAALPPDRQNDPPWLRILVVDDDHIIRTMLETWLRNECRYTVVVAKDGREALALALSFKPHVVLTDWRMPVMDGLELCKTLRASDWAKDLYVLMLTSGETEVEIMTAFDAGVDDYICKPVNLRVLKARLKAAWRFARLQDAWLQDRAAIARNAVELSLSNRRLQHATMTDTLT